MKDFLARLGYVASFAFGTPKQPLQGNFDAYYNIGLALFILGIVATTMLFIISIYLIAERRNKCQTKTK